MIKLKNMSFQNIGRFVEVQTIDFDSLPQISQIEGRNKNTDGSSGSGKSTIFQALEFVLGVNEVPSTVLQSRLTKSGISVQLVLEKDGKEYVVSRSKADGLSIKGPEGTIEGSNKVSEDYLQTLVGIPQLLLRKVFHKRQNEGGFFVGLTPKESYEFLTETLDLTTWSKKQAKLTEQAKTYASALDMKNVEIQGIESSLSGTKMVLNSMVPPEPIDAEIDSKIVILKSQLDIYNKEYGALESEKKSQKDAIVRPVRHTLARPQHVELSTQINVLRNKIVAIESAQRAELDGLTAKRTQLTASVLTASRAAEDLVSTQAAIESVKQEMIKIKSSICPTCAQSWTNDTATKALAEKADLFRALIAKSNSQSALASTKDELTVQLQAVIAELSAPKPNLTQDLEQQVQALQKQQGEIDAEYHRQVTSANALYDSENAAYIASISAIDSAFSARAIDGAQKINTATQELAELNRIQSTFIARQKDYENQKAALSTTLASTEAKLKKASEEWLLLERQQKVFNASATLVKSYVNQLFQGALDQIASRANEILSSIPNTNTMTVSFEAFKETKTGAVKEEITPYIHMDGEVKVPLKSLSGGERTSVELAVDIAVIEMIETYAGKGLNVFIMDEPMTGLDSVSACAIIDMLSMSNLSKKIILVDHNKETTERVPYKMNVIRDGQESRLEQ